jgi:glycosyltransferase involved in cell wall biosynthesis
LIKYYNIKEDLIKVIPTGVDTDTFNLTKSSEELRKIYGNSVLIYSGLMVPRKRVHILLKAMTYIIKEIPDIHLILTGEGVLLVHYKKLAEDLGIQNNVSFLGFVQDEELSKLYASSDLFVFPSELEGFGQVLLEAMASETPVICADKPPMSDLIEDGGITFKLNDPKDLSEKIVNLLKDKQILTDLKNNTKRIIKKYEWSNIVKIYQHYINQIIKLNKKQEVKNDGK